MKPRPALLAALVLLVVAGGADRRPTAAGPGPSPTGMPAGLGARLMDLGTLPGGTGSLAAAVNASGAVVGESDLLVGPFVTRHAFYWSEEAGGMVDLGTLPPATGVAVSAALGINNRNQVVGVSQNASGVPHAFLFEVSAVGEVLSRTDLGVLPDFPASVAQGINDKGQVVGVALRVNGSALDERAFFWSAATGVTDLGTLGGSLSNAAGINDQGDVVGVSTTDAGGTRGFRFRVDDHGNVLERTILEPPGTGGEFFSSSQATAVNAMGRISGFGPRLVGVQTPARGIFWPTPDSPQEMDVMPGGQSARALALNERGIAVGQGDTGDGAVPRAFAWSAATGAHDLSQVVGDSFFEVTTARGINRDGTIVGAGIVSTNAVAARRRRTRGPGSGGEVHALLLDLCPADVTRDVRIQAGPVRREGGPGPTVFVQEVSIRNRSSQPILGRLRLVTGDLRPGVQLLNATGATVCTPPGDQPYIDAGEEAVLPPGERRRVTLVFGAGRRQAIRYRPVALAGGVIP